MIKITITLNSDSNCEVSGDLSHAHIGSDSLRQVRNRFLLGVKGDAVLLFRKQKGVRPQCAARCGASEWES